MEYLGSSIKKGKSYSLTLDSDKIDNVKVNEKGYFDIALTERKEVGNYGETHNVIPYKSDNPYNILRLNINKENVMNLENEYKKIKLSIVPKSEKSKLKDLLHSDYSVIEDTYQKESKVSQSLIENFEKKGIKEVQTLVEENKNHINQNVLRLLENAGYDKDSELGASIAVYVDSLSEEKIYKTFVGSGFDLGKKKEYLGSMEIKINENKGFEYGVLSLNLEELIKKAGEDKTFYLNLSERKDEERKFSVYKATDKFDKYAKYTLKIRMEEIVKVPKYEENTSKIFLIVDQRLKPSVDKTDLNIYYFNSNDKEKIYVGTGFSENARYWMKKDHKEDTNIDKPKPSSGIVPKPSSSKVDGKKEEKKASEQTKTTNQAKTSSKKKKENKVSENQNSEMLP